MHRKMRFATLLAPAALGVILACPASQQTQDTLFISANPRQINSAGELADIHIEATTKAGATGTGTVTLTAPHGIFDVSSGSVATVTLTNGKADVGYSCSAATDSSCNGTISLAGAWGSANYTVLVTVGAADAGSGTGTGTDAGTDAGTADAGSDAGVPDAGLADAGLPLTTLANIYWVSTVCNGKNCPVMGIANSGFNTSAQVTFKVTDALNNPVANTTVTFSLNSAPYNTKLVQTAAVTDSNGQALAVVTSGSTIGSFSVHASVTAPLVDGGTNVLSADSATIGVRGAKPSNQGFYFECLPVNIPAYINPDPNNPKSISVTCTVRLVDRFSNPVGTGTPVNFKSEAGSIPSSELTKAYDPTQDNAAEGTSSVTFSTQGIAFPQDVAPLAANAGQFPTPLLAEPAYNSGNMTTNPRDGLVTLLAYTRGEEFFYDDNNNGQWDPGETFIDQGEAFIDANDNNQWDPGEVYIDDSPQNGQYDGPNGTYDKDTTIWTEARILYTGYPDFSGNLTDTATSTGAYPKFTPFSPASIYLCNSGVPMSGKEIVTAYFPDKRFNRPASEATLSASHVATDGTVSSLPDLQDGFGFQWERRLLNAAGTAACTAGTGICQWKTLFYNWDYGKVGAVQVNGLTSVDTNQPACIPDTASLTLTQENSNFTAGFITGLAN